MSLKGLSIPKQRELENLARKIKASHDATCQMAKQIREQCNEAVAEAILCGQALNRAKRICGHGRWMDWLREKCPKISIPTADRYMRLANSSHVINLKDAKSLRHAYLMVGVIPEREQVAKGANSVELEQGDASDTREAGQCGSRAITDSQQGARESRPTRADMAPNLGIRPASQSLVPRSLPTISAPAAAVHPMPPAESKRLHHLETLVQSITDILDEIPPTEEQATLEALQPICDWVARRR